MTHPDPASGQIGGEKPRLPSDLDLFELQAEMSMDDRRRLAGLCGLTIAMAVDGQRLFLGSEVPEGLEAALVEAVSTALCAPSPDVEPPALCACRAILEPACGPLAVHASPDYVFPPDLASTPETYTEMPLRMVRSDRRPLRKLRSLTPGNWEYDEWDDLLDGTLGPWAIALVDERVVSICHTPLPMTDRAAECGVWTHPDYRGRGYAAAVTATWAAILRPSGRHLFYSTDAANYSSQRVAARLGLRPIGWTWNLARVHAGEHDSRHPLSRRRS
jgi:RimJ/RimL family protein N-acetyltransferase